MLEQYSGEVSEFYDWEFQVVTVVRGHGALEEHLDFCKKRDAPISKAAQVEFKTFLGENGEAKLERFAEQLYTILAAILQWTAFANGEECSYRVWLTWRHCMVQVHTRGGGNIWSETRQSVRPSLAPQTHQELHRSVGRY